MATKKEKPVHLDILGQEIIEGCYVTSCHGNQLYVCKVAKISPIKMRVMPINKDGWYAKEGWLTYPKDTVKISGEEAMIFILKHG